MDDQRRLRIAHDLVNAAYVLEANLTMLTEGLSPEEQVQAQIDCREAVEKMKALARELENDEETTAEVCRSHGARVNRIQVAGGRYCTCCGTATLSQERLCPACSKPGLLP